MSRHIPKLGELGHHAFLDCVSMGVSENEIYPISQGHISRKEADDPVDLGVQTKPLTSISIQPMVDVSNFKPH
jgi:hypothetical protein